MNTQDYDEKTTKKAKEVAESYIMNNYQEVETVEFNGVEKGQLGGGDDGKRGG